MACPAIEIEQAVLAAIINAGIPDLDAGSVFAREQAERIKSDPPRSCVIVVGNERPVSRTNQTAKLEYPVLVVVSNRTALTAPASDAWKKEARYSLRQLLWKSFLLGPQGIVRGCEYNSDPEFAAIGFDQNFKVSGQLFTYRTEETQTP